MVVPVLITSCQVSEKSKIGPVIAQARIDPEREREGGHASREARGRGGKALEGTGGGFVVMGHAPPSSSTNRYTAVGPGHAGTAL